MSDTLPVPPLWINEVNWADASNKDEAPKKYVNSHVVEDIEGGGLIVDGAAYPHIVEAMSNAIIDMHRKKILYTDRSFALYGFTPNQVHYCHMDAAVRALPHIQGRNFSKAN